MVSERVAFCLGSCGKLESILTAAAFSPGAFSFRDHKKGKKERDGDGRAIGRR